MQRTRQGFSTCVEKTGQLLARMPRGRKQAIAIAADCTFLPAALAAALLLKFDGHVPLSVSPYLFIVALVAGLTAFAALGLYRQVVRYIELRTLFVSCFGVVLAAASLALVDRSILRSAVPLSAFTIFAALALIYVGLSRLLLRALLQYRRSNKEPVAIYGAGDAGVQLVTALRNAGKYRPVAFLDDNPALQRQVVAGIDVRPPRELARLIEREAVSCVLLAMPSQSHRRRRAILESLQGHAVRVETIPDISDIVAGRATVTDVREVNASDLLGRDPVQPNSTLLDGCIRGKVVMVTGAGGSIGAELARQIMRLSPLRLVLVEMSEPALYQIERELRSLSSSLQAQVEIVALLGNVHHQHRVRDIMHRYGVQTVYHAAAYKHVPIVEQNIIEGVHNNVFSTWYAAEAALECRVETFVLVSTDKAVNPTNVMGATKRCAELTLQAMQERSSHTRFCMVRFGNVLESSGSVVPLFREQIKSGGPVTVTHKDVTRYFMTIPEASQLVLQAGPMAQGGDVFVLDMGEPVRIEDLARRMIRAMGLTERCAGNPDGDIEIVYTGLRPAEKLYEELLIGNNVVRTIHPRIRRATEHRLPWVQMKVVLDELLNALREFDCARARDLLMRVVVEYQPQDGIQDLVWARVQQLTARGKVTDLRQHRIRQQSLTYN
jgi:FlaA1/EpsC-like NDP-sugar epimerase